MVTGTITNDDAPAVDNFTLNGAQVAGTAYLGPVSYLQLQYLGGSQDEVVIATEKNDFINLLGGADAADGGVGDDVIDGGLGSNFLTGGAGRDVFFLDGRSGGVTWGTITDWRAGEELSLWGWRPGASKAQWVEIAGAQGFQGATMHADLDGNGSIDASVTWANHTRGDLPVPTEHDGLLWFHP
jgi:serralysin